MGDGGDDEAEPLAGECLVLAEKGGAFEASFKAVVRPALAEHGIDDSWISWMSPAALARLNPAGGTKAAGDVLRTLVKSAVVVVDVTKAEPDAMYVLALCHLLRDSLTVAVYSGFDAPGGVLATLHKPYIALDGEGGAAKLSDAIRGLRDPRERLSAGPWRLSRAVRASLEEEVFGGADQVEEYATPGGKLRIAVALGDIAAHTRFGVWVNSENTEMEMARVSDRSVSARIRFRGSGAYQAGQWKESGDWICRDLAQLMGSRREVAIGEVLITKVRRATLLAEDNKVRAVAHVAAVQPAGPGQGFISTGRAGLCVRNVLDEVRTFARRKFDPDELKSVLFPLLGSGDGGAPVEVVAGTMMRAISRYFDPAGGELGKGADYFRLIGVAALKPRDADACRAALEASGFERVQAGASQGATPQGAAPQGASPQGAPQ